MSRAMIRMCVIAVAGYIIVGNVSPAAAVDGVRNGVIGPKISAHDLLKRAERMLDRAEVDMATAEDKVEKEATTVNELSQMFLDPTTNEEDRARLRAELEASQGRITGIDGGRDKIDNTLQDVADLIRRARNLIRRGAIGPTEVDRVIKKLIEQRGGLKNRNAQAGVKTASLKSVVADMLAAL